MFITQCQKFVSKIIFLEIFRNVVSLKNIQNENKINLFIRIVLKIFAWGFFGKTKAPEATEEDVEAEHQTAALVLFGHHDDFRVGLML